MDYVISILILICIYIILSTSVDIVFSNAGIFSVSHAAFFGLGGLVYAVLSKMGNISYFIIIISAALSAGLVAGLIAVSTLRIKGDYFIIASFGFQMIAYDIFYNWVRLASGSSAIFSIPKPVIFGITLDTTLKFFIFVLIITIICVGVCWRISRSPFGRILRAISESESAVQSSGRNPLSYKIKALVVSGILAAFAGMLYSAQLTIFAPDSFTVDKSIYILSMVIIGGSGNILGAIVGATILILLPQVISFFKVPSTIVGPIKQILYGLLLIIFMRIRPQGILGQDKSNE